MARYYNTVAPEFIDDFIFEPNWDLAMQAAQIQDNIAREAIQTMEIVGNPVFDYDIASEESAKRVKNYWESRIDDLAKEIGEISDPRELKRRVTKLKRELLDDYQHGEIKRITDEALAIRAQQEKIDALESIENRELFQKGIDHYRNAHGGFASDHATFEPYVVGDIKYDFETFLASPFFTQLVSDSESSEEDILRGFYKYTIGEDVDQRLREDIDKAYKSFINSVDGLEHRISFGEKYNNEFNWRDEEGNLRFDEESMLGAGYKDFLDAYSYRKTKTITKIAANDIEFKRRQLALQAANSNRGRDSNRKVQPYGAGSRNREFITNNTEWGREKKKKFFGNLQEMIENHSGTARELLENRLKTLNLGGRHNPVGIVLPNLVSVFSNPEKDIKEYEETIIDVANMIAQTDQSGIFANRFSQMMNAYESSVSTGVQSFSDYFEGLDVNIGDIEKILRENNDIKTKINRSRGAISYYNNVTQEQEVLFGSGRTGGELNVRDIISKEGDEKKILLPNGKEGTIIGAQIDHSRNTYNLNTLEKYENGETVLSDGVQTIIRATVEYDDNGEKVQSEVELYYDTWDQNLDILPHFK